MMGLIERFDALEARLNSTGPKWVRGTAERDNHLSGALREMADEVCGIKNPSIFEAALEVAVRELLDEAAEALDDAHEEWLNTQLAARDLVGDINALHCPQDPRPDELSEGSGSFYGGFHPSYDDDSCLETQCYVEWPNLKITSDQMAAVLRGEEYKL